METRPLVVGLDIVVYLVGQFVLKLEGAELRNALALTTVTAALLPLPYLLWLIQADRRRLLLTGLPGTALIERATPTGGSENDRPRIRFELRMSIKGRTDWHCIITMAPDSREAAELIEGRRVPLRVDPKRSSNAIDRLVA